MKARPLVVIGLALTAIVCLAALLRDLKQRGMLKETLVIWGGEFGRLPMAQMRPGSDAAKAGRDHGPSSFNIWMAGARITAGTVYGATDDIGWRTVENRVSANEWHATILHALGMRHEELFLPRHGLNERLTGVEKAHVVTELFS